MPSTPSSVPRALLIWGILVLAVAIPLIAATRSPLLAWREPVYIAAGFAGAVALALLLLQPLLMSGRLPGVPRPRGRRIHLWIGSLLVMSVILHVGGLWITSPPDVVDALLFVSATSFSAWGVIAMWAVFSAALVAALRRRLRLKPKVWRRLHTGLAVVIVIGSVVHALLIDGTMETVSKAILCFLALVATAKVLHDLGIWKRRRGSSV